MLKSVVCYLKRNPLHLEFLDVHFPLYTSRYLCPKDLSIGQQIKVNSHSIGQQFMALGYSFLILYDPTFPVTRSIIAHIQAVISLHLAY